MLIILASKSPRRRMLLESVGIDCTVLPISIDESMSEGEKPTSYVERIAREKMQAAFVRQLSEQKESVILSADTIVVIDGQVLQKPKDDLDAFSMLSQLLGRSHQVMTAVSLGIFNGPQFLKTVTTQVEMSRADEASIHRYIATGEGRDKAGSYAIQGIAGGWVRSIQGSYTNVVGLPLQETIELLCQLGALKGFP